MPDIVKSIPNFLTVTRVVLIPFFLNFLVYGYIEYALIIFVAAALTDALDGTIARLTHSQSEVGATLDPLADKLLALAAFVALTIRGLIPLWLTLTVVFRDVVIVSGSAALYFMGYKVKVRPYLTGKLTTFFQLSLVVAALYEAYSRSGTGLLGWLAWFTLLFSVASGMQYVMRGLRIVSGREDAANPN
jgi:cardiolipin synthase (CMP-forming)